MFNTREMNRAINAAKDKLRKHGIFNVEILPRIDRLGTVERYVISHKESPPPMYDPLSSATTLKEAVDKAIKRHKAH